MDMTQKQFEALERWIEAKLELRIHVATRSHETIMREWTVIEATRKQELRAAFNMKD